MLWMFSMLYNDVLNVFNVWLVSLIPRDGIRFIEYMKCYILLSTINVMRVNSNITGFSPWISTNLPAAELLLSVKVSLTHFLSQKAGMNKIYFIRLYLGQSQHILTVQVPEALKICALHQATQLMGTEPWGRIRLHHVQNPKPWVWKDFLNIPTLKPSTGCMAEGEGEHVGWESAL